MNSLGHMHSVNRSGKLQFLGIAVFLLLLSGCLKIDTPPALEIQVLDSFNNPVKNAVVGLFDNQEEWGMLENPIQVWRTTDQQGRVRFLNLLEKKYYIFAEKGALNNLKTEIVISDKLLRNELRLITIHIE